MALSHIACPPRKAFRKSIEREKSRGRADDVNDRRRDGYVRFRERGLVLDPIDTLLDGVVEVERRLSLRAWYSFAIGSVNILVGEELERAEADVGDVEDVLTVNALGSIERGAGAASLALSVATYSVEMRSRWSASVHETPGSGNRRIKSAHVSSGWTDAENTMAEDNKVGWTVDGREDFE